ncbi:hypothetical protein NAC44_03655 [Allorhizobium sp. BGMRC 0089]|uniref:hypothetical protein n=1 Tax=Allorhizobium sonneratiae TaxID=2934936 RepID=UPI002033E87A|nr:hypothetical protein [Allorhizobium sonneratiae]MCM2291423.1 hypothetical protein [Allorhizobium sonneratiae]
MKLEEFKKKYDSNIIVQLQWNLLNDDVEIEKIDLEGFENLERLCTAWYAPQDDESTDYKDYKKVNITVKDIVDGSRTIKFCHSDRIEKIKEKLNLGDCKISLDFPVYGLPDEKYFLLDGNHRAVAAVLAKAQPVTLYVLKGPILSCILPDLWRWEGQ